MVMAQPLAISLQPLPDRSDQQQPLADVIRQISQQKGSFRSVTEAKLLEEIQDDDDGVAVTASPDTPEEAPEEPKPEPDALLKTKEEILREISSVGSNIVQCTILTLSGKLEMNPSWLSTSSRWSSPANPPQRQHQPSPPTSSSMCRPALWAQNWCKNLEFQSRKDRTANWSLSAGGLTP